MQQRGIRIAVDGYSSTGKSTMAKALADRLNFRYIDTGAMYRALTYWAIEKGFFRLKKLNEAALIESLTDLQLDFKRPQSQGSPHIYLNGEDVEGFIRKSAVADKVSLVAKVSGVRKFLVAQQRQIAESGAVVMDGRDIGSVVIPDAELKIFMTADPDIRAQRRYRELKNKGELISLEAVKRNLAERDHLDTTREDSPLVKTQDAQVLDNSNLSRDEQLALAEKWARERMN